MKKTLLLTLVALSSMTINAEIDSKTVFSFPAVESKTDVKPEAKPLLFGNSIYVSGSFNQPIDICGEYFEPIGKSSYIIKANLDTAEPVWAAAIIGASSIKATTTDKEGNIYIAATFADEIKVATTGKDESEWLTIKGYQGTDEASGLILKLNPAGEILASFNATATRPVIEGEYYGGAEYFSVNNIEISDDKLYVGVQYTGNYDFTTCQLTGAYANVYGIEDVKSYAVLKMALNDLSVTEKVLDVAMPAEDNFGPFKEAVTSGGFTLVGGNVAMVFAAQGNIAVNGKTVISDKSYIDSDNTHITTPYAASLIMKDGEPVIHIWEFPETEKFQQFYINEVKAWEEKDVFVGGTYTEKCPFDPTVLATRNYDAFCTIINPATGELASKVFTSGVDETYGEDIKSRYETYVTATIAKTATERTAIIGYTADRNKKLNEGFFTEFTPEGPGINFTEEAVTNMAFFNHQDITYVVSTVFNTISNNSEAIIAYETPDDPEGIEANDSEAQSIESIYTTSGVKSATLQQGINIVNFSNGNSGKVLK